YTQLTVIEKEQNVCTYNIGSYSVYQDDFLERNYIGYGSGYVSTTYLGVAAVKEIP
ncbi:MAG: hypothetical protein JHC93_04640, partial [Parachlamydiales bacterium]|nr:hypothetical protein [Parachlamydiales bacterium]